MEVDGDAVLSMDLIIASGYPNPHNNTSDELAAVLTKYSIRAGIRGRIG